MTWDALNRLTLYMPKENRIAPTSVSIARDCAVGALVCGAESMKWSYGYWSKSAVVVGSRGVLIADVECVVDPNATVIVDVKKMRWLWDERVDIKLRAKSPRTGPIRTGLPTNLDKRGVAAFARERLGHYARNIAAIRAVLESFTGVPTLETRSELEAGLRGMPDHWARAAYAMLNEPSMWLRGLDLALFAKAAS